MLLDGVSGRSGGGGGGGRSLSIDRFFAEPPKAQLAVVQEADGEGDAHDDAGAGTGGAAAAAAGAGASAGASGSSKGLLKTMSKKDLALVSAQKHIKEKKRRSLMPSDGSAIVAAMGSRRLSDGDVRHRVEDSRAEGGFSWLEPIHVPRGMFSAHERRTKKLLRAIGYDDEEAEQRVRHLHLHGHHDHHGHSLNRGDGDGSAGGGGSKGDGSEDDAESEDEEGMCDAYCGDNTRLGVFLYWMLLPSALIRQISTPLVGEEDYQWHFAAVTPLFGFPFVFVTAFVSIGSPGGILQEIGGTADGGFSYLIFSIILGALCSAAAFWVLPRDAPPKGILLTLFVLFAFLTSVSWIITVANEIVTLLVALGFALNVSAEILGLTVLAWGNSLGDLVADVSVARAGTPKMALAACFAGPLFNLLMGLGLSLTVQTLKEEDHVVDMTNPSGNNPLNCHQINIVWSCFGFLLLSLVSSMVVVAVDGFRLRRFWGLTLIIMYAVFLGVSFVLQFTDIGCG
jgi:Ca2+/Na+ antiporter